MKPGNSLLPAEVLKVVVNRVGSKTTSVITAVHVDICTDTACRVDLHTVLPS
eukprot:m.221227 g.221227  ORF g.221227 m.221227 type:complete len:52 (-) comp19183_c0_seq1:1190-1345(-)